MTATEVTSTIESSAHSDSPSFENLLPSIQRCATYAFRQFPPTRRQELVDDVVADAYVAYVRLIERRLAALIYPTALAKFAIKRVKAGRQVGCRQSVRDVLSRESQAKQPLAVERLEHQDAHGQWQERLIVDRRATPAELVSCKLDFSAWLGRLVPRKREVALRLAAGDTTCEAARHFKLSPARLSQLRHELESNWNAFQRSSVI